MLVKLRATHAKRPSFTETLKYHLPLATEDNVFNFKFYFLTKIHSKMFITNFELFIAD